MAGENDIVLIYMEDEPVSFARIENISPDVKADWYHVKLLLLQLPLQTMTWILRDSYIDGAAFTMGGKNMRLETIVCPEDPPDTELSPEITTKKNPGAEQKKYPKVISLSDLKNKKQGGSDE